MANVGVGPLGMEMVADVRVADEGVAPSETVADEGMEDVVSPRVDEVAVYKAKNRAVDMPETVVGKRSRVPSQYVVFSFTTEAKRRRFINGRYPILFREIDHAKWKAFEAEWRRMLLGATHMIAGRTILDAYKWFHDITTQGAWLVDDYIDMAMNLLRDRVERYPQSFHKPGRIILNTEFFRAVTSCAALKSFTSCAGASTLVQLCDFAHRS
ncbi:uncharacterized protein LOC111372194 [Olea europaea var. sylvestris]|uniref:uncharacterized protein LOC111372194 n=1 Tax=Olea europaea var. sylvestris TaxID=158386 RepID=UPI000C1D81D8|nr:uncharacterized protein LOC111372194 [Olea europaea var. sylvestris]